jgi:hypothetical protein
MSDVNYQTRIFLHRYVSHFKSVNHFRIYTFSNLLLSGIKKFYPTFLHHCIFLRILSHSCQVMGKKTTTFQPSAPYFKKAHKILLKLVTTLFNHRPKIFRQRSSNKTQLNMNCSNRIHTDSPRDLATT